MVYYLRKVKLVFLKIVMPVVLIAVTTVLGVFNYLMYNDASVSFYDTVIVDSSNIINFNQPSKTLTLPFALSEISGLDYDSKNDVLLAVNDERGKIYKIHKEKGKIVSKISFGDAGDYEGIEIVNDQIVMVNSSGALFFYDPDRRRTREVPTILSQANDVEGLFYDKKKERLLLACKGKVLKKGKKYERAVYAYDLEADSLKTKPYLKIDIKDLKKFMKANKPDFTTFSRIEKFAPSAIVRHPETKDIYVCSARGSSLLIYDKEKEIKNIVFLNEYKIPQPEGLSFDDDGNLYISSEGRRGKIFRFDAK